MAKKALHILIALGLLQGIVSAHEARQLWHDKIALQEIVYAPNISALCHRLVEHGL